jgi:HK97 gp10 family phage protein
VDGARRADGGAGMITMRVQNLDAVNQALRQYGAKAEQAIGQAIQATGLEILTDIKKRIQRGPKTGRTYLRGTVSHRASAPGEAPATDTGALVSSVAYSKVNELTAQIESRLPYATFLEFGTVNMDPRPAWTPAVEQAAPKLQQRVIRAIEGLV